MYKFKYLYILYILIFKKYTIEQKFTIKNFCLLFIHFSLLERVRISPQATGCNITIALDIVEPPAFIHRGTEKDITP